MLATSTLPQKKSKNMLVHVAGPLLPGVTSKDIVLHVCGVIGTAGGTGSTIEFAGEVSQRLLCSMRTDKGQPWQGERGDEMRAD